MCFSALAHGSFSSPAKGAPKLYIRMEKSSSSCPNNDDNYDVIVLHRVIEIISSTEEVMYIGAVCFLKNRDFLIFFYVIWWKGVALA